MITYLGPILLTPGMSEYPVRAAQLTAEPLRSQWAADAESEHEDGTSYVMVLALDDVLGDESIGALVPAAWAGYRVETHNGVDTLRCCSNYERREFRGHNLYALAYEHRHRTIVQALGLPGLTYLYRQPLDLHERDGWFLDDTEGGSGTSTGPTGEQHDWFRLLWTPGHDAQR